MKVCLLGRITSDTSLKGGDGRERYTINLRNKLVKYGVEIHFPFPKSIKYCSTTFRSISGLIRFDLLSLPVLLFRKPEFDICHATFPQQGLSFSLVKNRNLIVTAHHVDDQQDFPRGLRFALFQNYFKTAYNIATKYSRHIIAVSEQTKQELISKLNIPEEKITVVHSGVDERFHPFKKKESEVRTIGYLGSLTKRKNVDYLIQVFKILKQKYPKFKIQLEIYGIGPEYHNLLRSTRQCKDVKFKGFASEQKIVEIYNTFDVFVFPSQHEGFGLPILEAQRCGVPVFVRKTAKIPDEIKKYAVQCKTMTDMAKDIFTLLSDESSYKKVSKEGFDYSKQFTWDECAKKTIEVYEKVVKKVKSVRKFLALQKNEVWDKER